MQRTIGLLALLVALGASAGAAQTRVSVSIGFGTPAPYVAYHPRVYRQPYIVYYPRAPLIVIGRPAYHAARVIVVEPRRHHHRRHRHFHGYR